MNNDITIYTKQGCPKCKGLKMLLDKEGIKYEINDSIEEMKQKGMQTLPMLQVGDMMMDYNEAKKWIRERMAM